tara:strand:+ start:386 stop:547 length:162 start_codon:yes stop_codon:yes gene_type:complete
MKREINWVTLGIIILNTIIWYSIFTNGFWVTLLWVIIIASIIGLCIKVWEIRI